MAFVAESEAPPLREDESGALRIGGTRVLLELVIQAFQNGATPESIVQSYSTLELPDVYAVIAYYLRHRSTVDDYLAERERLAVTIQRETEYLQGDLTQIRARLMAARKMLE